MRIEILHLIEGAKQARGLTVVIDVFRAFSTACYVANNGAKKIIPVSDLKMAYELERSIPDSILMGERNNIMPPGFDYGNSPTHIQNIDFTGKTIIHTTSAGTQGIYNSHNATEIISGSFVNAGAIIKYIKNSNPERVSLVCMGNAALYPADEDTSCAEYIRNELVGNKNNFDNITKHLRNGAGLRLLDPKNKEHSPAEDFSLCLDLNRFNFILRAVKDNDLYYFEKNRLL